MIYFRNDYSEFACPQIIEALSRVGLQKNDGYGLDAISASARKKIQQEIGHVCDIHFLVGGTQANLIMLEQILRPYESVIAVSSGHINIHESGSIEGVGHKVETIPDVNGKLDPEKLDEFMQVARNEHTVIPKCVYISNSTEFGTIYALSELRRIREVCDRYGLYLYVDGARLGVALTAEGNDLTMKDLYELADCFYIGATKNGGLLGEAMVIRNEVLSDHFRNIMKRRGAMLAKGFVIGLQFDVLFTDGLYYDLARHANEMAMLLKKGLQERNVEFYLDSPTNQQFIVIDNGKLAELERKYSFELWEKGRERSSIRLVTSWATDRKDVEEFLRDFE